MTTYDVDCLVGETKPLKLALQTRAYTAPTYAATTLASATVYAYEEGGQTTGACDAGGSASTVVDAERTETTADFWKGATLEFINGDNVGQRRRVSGFAVVTDTLTLDVTTDPLPATPTGGDGYILHGYPVVLLQDLASHADGEVSGNVASFVATPDNGCTATPRRVMVVITVAYADGSDTATKSAAFRLNVESPHVP